MKTHDPNTTCLNSSTILSQQSVTRYVRFLSLLGRWGDVDRIANVEVNSMADCDAICKDALDAATRRLIRQAREVLGGTAHDYEWRARLERVVQGEVNRSRDALVSSLARQHRLAEADRTSDSLFFWIESFQRDIELYLIWVQSRLQQLCRKGLSEPIANLCSFSSSGTLPTV